MATTKTVTVIRSTDEGSRLTPASNVKMRCGDCIYLSSGRSHPQYGQPCNERGILEKAHAPTCFVPDVSAMNSLGSDALEVIGLISSLANSRQSRILIALLRAQSKLKDLGLHLMQKVYFSTSVTGDFYLTDFYAAYALGVGANNEIFLSATPQLSNSGNMFVASLPASALYDETTFQELKARLVEMGRVQPPVGMVKLNNAVDVDYEVPTIEMSAELVESLQTHRASGKRGRGGVKTVIDKSLGKKSKVSEKGVNLDSVLKTGRTR